MSSLDPAEMGDSRADLNDTNGTPSSGASLGALSTLDNRLPSVSGANWSYGPPPRPEILSAKPNPLELMHAVRRRWPLAIGLGMFVGLLTSGLIWYFLPVKYEAFALLRVEGKPPKVLESTVAGVDEFDVFKRTQVQLILSNVVLNGTLRERAINQLSMVRDFNDDPVSWLKDELAIDYPSDAEIMRISMTGERRDEIVKIVDKVVEVYMREIVQRDKSLKIDHEQKLKDSYATLSSDYEKELNALRTLQTIHKTAGSQGAQLKQKMAMDELGMLVSDRKKVLDQMAENDRDMMLIRFREKNPQDSMPHDAIVDMQLSKDPVIAESNKKIAEYNEVVQHVRGLAKNPQSLPYLKTLQKNIEHLEEAIHERKETLKPKIVEWMMIAGASNTKDGAGAGLNMKALEQDQEFLKEKLADLDKQVETKTREVSDMESFSAQVAAKEEQIAALRTIKNQVGAEVDRIRVERLAPDRITLVDKATIANGRGDALRKYIAVAFGGIFGFSAIVLSIAFIEFWARKVNSVKEVNDGLGIRVIGELPSIGGRAFRRLKGGKGPAVLKALMAERIDGTRTAIMHTTAVDPPRVVMVTSAQPHEGKTTTSSQLAASLARSGRRTLLIDADIRNPGVHRVFDMPQDPGLCELLRGEAERDAVIHPTRTANLWLMPGGRCDLRSVQALSSSFLGTVIAALSVQYDYVVIDAGPVLKVADPLLVGQHVDAAIVSVLRDVSRVPDVYEAVERLRSVGITVLGSVVNGVKDDVARHGVELLMAETPQGQKAETTTA